MNLNKDILGYIRQDLLEFREEICAQLKILTTHTVNNRTDISLLQAETLNIHNECSTQGNILNKLDICLKLKKKVLH